MTRGFALALLGILLAVVVGQEMRLRQLQAEPVTEIRLHESRLVTFLHEIRPEDPDTVDSILLNLQRLRDAQAQGQDVQLEEAVVAGELLARLTAPTAPKGAASAASAATR